MMNKTEAKHIAKTITNEQLREMFDKAKIGITDWTKVSSVNRGHTKGVAWNILAKDFDVDYNHHNLAKVNMIREFGDFLPLTLRLPKKNKAISNPPFHQDPIF
tara:strand:+ start:918 stop:1226 length:309 start_codon:yes stop_codon:yes gene_type:complete